MAVSGQTRAQAEQPVHSPADRSSAKRYPRVLKEGDSPRHSCGHAATQSSQPLQSSLATTMVPWVNRHLAS